SLGGVECLTAVVSLQVDAFQLNLDPLRALPRLESLFLGPVPASTPPVLPGVKSLECAGAPGHGFVSKFPGLTALTIHGVQSDATPPVPLDLNEVAALSGLTTLALSNCALTDISPLSKLTSLSQLDLSANAITDLAPLVANTGVGAGDTVQLGGNDLTCASQGANIATLRNRGADVSVDITCSP
ncbi:MAG: leucine-rich repeat domain-containing protein, partial [Pseudomonadota bacterium]